MTSIAVRLLPASERASSILRTGARGRLSRPAVIDVAIATLVVLLIASPLLFTSDGFAPDFTNNMWLAGNQEHAIAAYLHPTLFIHTQQGGVFYPIFAFYGGTLFALTGALAATRQATGPAHQRPRTSRSAAAKMSGNVEEAMNSTHAPRPYRFVT